MTIGTKSLLHRIRHRRALLCLTTAAMLCLSAQSASAQLNFGGFGRAANQPFTGEVVVVNKAGLKQLPYVGVPRKVDLKPTIEAAISTVSRQVEQTIFAELPKRKTAGFTPYIVRFEPAKSKANDRMFIGTDGTGFTVRYVSVGHTVRVGLHTPDIIFGVGADRAANPEFTVNYGFELIVDVETGSLKPSVRNVRIKINAQRPDSANPTGDVLKVLNNVVSFLGGPDFLGKAQAKINGQERSVAGPIRVNLGRLDKALSNAGSRAVIRQVVDRGALHLELHKYTPPDVIR